MSVPNEINLRPRFRIRLDCSNQKILEAFQTAGSCTSEFVVTRVDDHVFIKIPQADQHFWTPQLDLEVVQFEEGHCTLHGLFGPKPTVWTMFMFFHFVVAGLFTGFGIWAYTRASLDEPYIVQVFLMGLMVLVWFVLYLAGRIGKATGRDQMLLLYNFMKSTLASQLPIVAKTP